VLDVVDAEEQRRFARRYKIRQVIDCGVIGAELLEVSLLKLTPAVRVMAKQGPEAGARGDVFSHTLTLACSFVSPRGQMRSTSTLMPSRCLGRLVDALDTRPRGPSRYWILQPSPLQRRAPRVRLPSRD
jgi:hypothetical protein